jgi:GT2 family glycosyltransferase
MIRTPVDVSLVVISLNSRDYLRACIDSILAAQWRSVTCEIVVTDNGSTDGTIEMLAAGYPGVRVMAHGRNLGFCTASNVAAEASSGRYVMFLNDDILIYDDAIARLVEWMDANPAAGAIGSRLLNPNGTDQHSSGRSWPTPMNSIFARRSIVSRMFPNARWVKQYLVSERINEKSPYRVDWLSAAAMMVRREAYEAAGQLAEDYYYFHELVFCRRMEKAGWLSYLHPQSKIMHYEGSGSGYRTLRVRRKHAIAFHMGAYKWYAEHHSIPRFSPLRILVAGALTARAAMVVAVEYLRAPLQRKARALHDSRPEGGTAL